MCGRDWTEIWLDLLESCQVAPEQAPKSMNGCKPTAIQQEMIPRNAPNYTSFCCPWCGQLLRSSGPTLPTTRGGAYTLRALKVIQPTYIVWSCVGGGGEDMQYLVLNPLNTVDTIYAYIYKCLHKCLPQNMHWSVCEAYAYTLRALKVIEPTLSEIVCVGEQGGGAFLCQSAAIHGPNECSGY